MKIKIFTFILSIVVSCSPLYGYKENIHEKTTGEAVKASSFLSYASNCLGIESITELSNGLFNRKTAKVWIESGGVEEDNFPRFLNHFYDPTTEKGIVFVLQQNSSIIWAKDLIGNDWDWASARDYFHESLTSTSVYIRETRLAATFRAVGQVMHLVEDLAAPAHVRNDVHIPVSWDKDYYEDFTNEQYLDDSIIPYSGYAPVDLSTFSSFDAFWKNTSKGLAEFTNNNFLSRDTNLDDNAYPSPVSIGEWITQETPDPSKPPVYVRYLQGYATDSYRPESSAPISKLAAFSYFDFEMKRDYPDKAVYTLNDGVHKEYAQFLVPRAVGYAAGLLNYFFRGTINLTFNPTDVSFRSVKITASNSTPNEVMGLGEARLVIRYKVLAETQLDVDRYLLHNPPAGTAISDYTYKVSAPLNVDLTSPQQLNFDFSADPLPYFFDDMTMQLVFKGKLGNEEGAVAVSKPEPINGIYTDFAISLPPSGVYAKTSDSSSSATFNELRVTAQTDIPGGLTGGVFKLALEYRKATTDPFQSLPVDSDPVDEAGYVIRVNEKNGVSSLQPEVPVELVFDLSSVSLPVWATDVYVNVIYVDAATSKTLAVGYHDISEPTPVDIFNNTDYVCISNQWYPAGTPEARTAADLAGNQNGLDDDIDTFMHNIANIYTKITSITTPVTVSTTNFDLYESGPVAPATLRRLGFVLADYTHKYSSLRDLLQIDPLDGWSGGSGILATLENGMAVKNQTDADGIYRYSSMYNMRGKPMWGGAGTVYGNLKLPADAVCDWVLLPNVQ